MAFREGDHPGHCEVIIMSLRGGTHIVLLKKGIVPSERGITQTFAPLTFKNGVYYNRKVPMGIYFNANE
jgi:hypothetical protein